MCAKRSAVIMNKWCLMNHRRRYWN